MEFFNNFPVESGVYFLTNYDPKFEEDYIAVRAKEKRVYSDETVRELPCSSKTNAHYSEWQIRSKSLYRVLTYFRNKDTKPSTFLDIGCGNGWFTEKLSHLPNGLVLGLDINKIELKQAARVFGSAKCRFAYGDLFSIDFQNDKFDVITLNASVQYFPSLKKLFQRLIPLLNPAGEIHLIDSPFYSKDAVASAKARSHAYYKKLGIEAMASNYFHHSWGELDGYTYSILYNPDSAVLKLKSKLGSKDSPFPWICIHHPG